MSLTHDERARLFEVADHFVGITPEDPVQAVFVRVWNLEGEVNSGGFLSYFQSSAGQDATAVVGDLRILGAPKMADIVSAALEVVGRLGSDDAGSHPALEHLSADDVIRLQELDDAFIAYPDGDMEPRHLAWIEAHRSTFSF